MSEVLTQASAIAQYITTLVEDISVVNGYNTDIGLHVYRGRRKIDDEMIPCAVILEGNDSPGDNTSRQSIKITQSYVLGGYVACDPDQPNDAAHLVIKDLKRAIFKLDPSLPNASVNFGGRVRSVAYQGRDIGPRADGKAIVFAVIFIDVVYAETLADA